MKNTLAQTALAAAALAAAPHQVDAAETLYRITDLGVLGCGTYCSSYATDINNLGQIVGRSTTSSGGWHAALWNTDGRAVDLGTTYGASGSSAESINNLGHVVGYSGSKAFYWDTKVGLWELNFAPAGNLTFASAINDQGVVTGFTADSLATQPGSAGAQASRFKPCRPSASSTERHHRVQPASTTKATSPAMRARAPDTLASPGKPTAP